METFPFPRDGVREAIYNALIHNNYASCVHIQIKIRDDAMYISNNCILPFGWNEQSLMQPHKSMPFNPTIANAFYRAGYIETWGRGIFKIFKSCERLGIPKPEYKIFGEDITVKFDALKSALSEDNNDNYKETEEPGAVSEKEKSKVKTSTETMTKSRVKSRVKIIELINNNSTITREELAEKLNLTLKGIDKQIKILKEKK